MHVHTTADLLAQASLLVSWRVQPLRAQSPRQVLEAAYEGKFEAAPLRFGEAISSRVEKAGAQYYTLELQQRHIDEGFAIGAHSVAGSKFKLLMFEANEAGQWELLLQEDSTKVKYVVVRCVLHCTACQVTCMLYAWADS